MWYKIYVIITIGLSIQQLAHEQTTLLDV